MRWVMVAAILGIACGLAACGAPSQAAPPAAPQHEAGASLQQRMVEALPTPSPSPSPSPSPLALPAAVQLAVPFTVQAPFGNWNVHQESCEEASLLEVESFLKGDRRAMIDPSEANRDLLAMKQWQVARWGAERDLSLDRIGQLAQQYYGRNYQELPASVESIKSQLAMGRPVMLPVMTHGLGNPHYGAKSVYHILVLVGFDSGGAIANDVGIREGRGYRYTWGQVFNAVDQVTVQDPAMRQGRVMVVLSPN
jgi:hypothetical protein